MPACAFGGSTWVDIGTGKYNGVTAGTNAPIGAARPAFVNRMSTPVLWPDFTTVTLNPVAGYSNQDVLVRFRVGADDSTGAPGWDVDDIAVTGITNTPFTALVPNAGVCGP